MRIAYVCLDPGVPVFGRKGSSVHCQEVMRAFLQMGFDVELFARRAGDDVPEDLSSIAVHRIGGSLDSDPAVREQQLARSNPIAVQMLQDSGPFDLVYERYSLWHCAGMQYAQASKTPAVLEVNSPLIHEQKTYRTLFDQATAESIRDTCFENATSIIAVSDEVADRVCHTPDVRKKTSVVANGVNCQKFEPFITQRDVHRTPITIGFLGTLKPWHGVSNLIDAFESVRISRPDVRLQIVGDGPEREKLETRLQRMIPDVSRSVEWTGAIANSDVPATLANFDIAVAPYPDLQDFYFSPLKILEYMAAGLPIVASRIGQIPNLINDGDTVAGLLTKSGSTRELAVGIQKLCEDPDLRFRLGKAARHKAVRQHTWHHVVSRILDIVNWQPDRIEVQDGSP